MIDYNVSDEEFEMNQRERHKEWVAKKLEEKAIELGITMSDITYLTDYRSKHDDDNEWKDGFFTGWSKDYVFIIGEYDGHEWIQVVPRNPVDISQIIEKVGGG